LCTKKITDPFKKMIRNALKEQRIIYWKEKMNLKYGMGVLKGSKKRLV